MPTTAVYTVVAPGVSPARRALTPSLGQHLFGLLAVSLAVLTRSVVITRWAFIA